MTFNETQTKYYRDPLSPEPEKITPQLYTASMLAILRDIRRELIKQNPDVLASVVVQNAAANVIGDTNNHRVYFQVSGKPVRIYKLVMFSSFDANVIVSVQPTANALDGIVLTNKNAVFELTVPLDDVNVRLASASNNCPVNGPADSAHGGLFIWGFTIADYDASEAGT